MRDANQSKELFSVFFEITHPMCNFRDRQVQSFSFSLIWKQNVDIWNFIKTLNLFISETTYRSI